MSRSCGCKTWRTVPDDTKKRAVWLWDEETVAEVLEELEAELDGSAPKLNGKQLLLDEGDWAGGDSDSVVTYRSP